MKYVILQVTQGTLKRELPVIFPDCVCHDDMALWFGEALAADKIKAVSAGFCTVRVNTSGSSETLGLKSRPEDDQLINLFDYYHGIR